MKNIKHATCYLCSGKKKIIDDDIEIDCPVCDGTGEIIIQIIDDES